MSEAGFEIHDGVLSPSDCDRVISDLAQSSNRRTRAGARHLMRVPAVAALSRSAELVALARRHVGPGAIPYRATLFEKSGLRNWLVVWHQDTTLPLEHRVTHPEWGPWSTKDGVQYAQAPAWALESIVALRIHLDASTPENGPLRVLPGSHLWGVRTDDEVFRRAREDRPLECLVGRGGVLVMRPLLIHSSSKARSGEPRRVLHVEYARELNLAPGIRLAIA